MMDLVQIMETDTKKTAKGAKLKEWFVAREAQMAQLSLDGKSAYFILQNFICLVQNLYYTTYMHELVLATLRNPRK